MVEALTRIVYLVVALAFKADQTMFSESPYCFRRLVLTRPLFLVTDIIPRKSRETDDSSPMGETQGAL